MRIFDRFCLVLMRCGWLMWIFGGFCWLMWIFGGFCWLMWIFGGFCWVLTGWLVDVDFWWVLLGFNGMWLVDVDF